MQCSTTLGLHHLIKNDAVTSPAATRGSAHFDGRLAGATRSGTAGVGGLSRSKEKATLHPSDVNWNISQLRAEGINAMWDAVFAYLISLGIIGAGVIWIVAGHSAPSAFGFIIGVPTIVVGLVSFFGELRV